MKTRKTLILSSTILAVAVTGFVHFGLYKASQNYLFSSPFEDHSRIVKSGDLIASLNFDDGWESAYTKAFPILQQEHVNATFYIITQMHDQAHMTDAQILDLYAKGNEIGAHTRTHPVLPKLSLEDQKTEIEGSRNDLLNLGIKSVTTFAYPYGRNSSKTETLVQGAGFLAGRGTDLGTNNFSTDKYALKSLDVKSDMDFPFIQKFIDDAVAQRQWLILTFHRVDENGDPVSASQSINHEILQQTIAYLKSQNVAIVTNAEGLALTRQ